MKVISAVLLIAVFWSQEWKSALSDSIIHIDGTGEREGEIDRQREKYIKGKTETMQCVRVHPLAHHASEMMERSQRESLVQVTFGKRQREALTSVPGH
ncbi:hypothetical protein PAMP_022672 [Pampus punctatissimus]